MLFRMSVVLEDEFENDPNTLKPAFIFEYKDNLVMVFITKRQKYIFTTVTNDFHNQTIVTDDIADDLYLEIEEHFYCHILKQ